MIVEREPVEELVGYLPARMINEFAYCPRLFYLEYVDGLFAHNSDTMEGQVRHQRVDRKADELPAASKTGERETLHARSVMLASESLQVMAKLDLIEATGDMATPVDYKRGSPKTLEDGTLSAWDPERIQLCVQGLVLRDNGYRCEEGILYFWETRQRVRIEFDDSLIELTKRTIDQARQLVHEQRIPLPLVNSPKCPRCSMVGICLPDETSQCVQRDSLGRALIQPLLFDIGLAPSRLREASDGNDKVRPLVSARDERRPLYLNSQGYTVGVSGEVLKVKDKTKVVQEIRLKDVCQISLFGNIQVSTQAVQAMLAQEIPLVYFSFGGWFHGMTQSVGLKNILWRREQFRMADRRAFCLEFARTLVAGKIRNQRTMLMRNHVQPDNRALLEMMRMARLSERATDLQELLGLEGLAARCYFEQFSGMIKVDQPQERCLPNDNATNGTVDERKFNFDFTRRNRRPPRDPVNALLSLGYSLLAKDFTIAAATVGLDPFLGYYHQPRCGRPALALDLMEPFRPLIVDSAVLSAINQRMVTAADFIAAGDSVALKPEGRKAFFRAYEQRMDQLVTHPIFGYRVSYRRVLEIQTRLLARVLVGEIARYPVFVTK